MLTQFCHLRLVRAASLFFRHQCAAPANQTSVSACFVALLVSAQNPAAAVP